MACLVAATLTLTLPGRAGLVGWWEFSDPADLGKATLGPDLEIVGSAPAHSASLADDDGRSLNGVITTVVGRANRLRLVHGIGANGGGSLTNEYTIIADVFSPPASWNQWRSLYQTNQSNANDTDYVIRNSDDRVGIGELGYSATAISEGTWTRLAISVDLGSSC